MRNALAALLALLALPALASAQAESDAPSVMVIGDSHIERLGPMIERAVSDAGYESLDSLARRGWSTRRYVRENDLAERLVENGSPDIVVVSLGGNDRARDYDNYREELSWIVSQAREAGAERIIWLGPAASDMDRSERAAMVGEWHEHNADWQSELLPEMGVEWVDSRPLTRTGHGRDGIHFTASAYSSWCHAALSIAHLETLPSNDVPTDNVSMQIAAVPVNHTPVDNDARG